MFPYYLLIIIPFFLEAVETMLRPNQGIVFARKNSNNSIVLFFVIWFVMLALRHISCGVDLINYQYHFYNICKLDFLNVFEYNPIEPLYYVLNWFLAQIYPDFRLVIVVAAFLCTGIIGWFYWKESEFAPLTILLFITNACFSMFYSGMRQSFAMLFVVPAYYLTKYKKIIPFILLVVFASYFHSSALVMLFLYPIFHLPLRSKYFVIALIMIALFFFFSSDVFTNVLPFLGEKYMEYELVETGAYGVLSLFLLFFLYSFAIVDERKLSPDALGLRNLLVLATVIQCFASVSTVAMRMNYYFILLVPVFISKIINKPKEGYEIIAQFFKWSFVIFLTLMFFYKGHMANNILQVFPYVAYWE